MDRLARAIDNQDKGVTMGTHTKYDRSWRIWLEFMSKIPSDDPYLLNFTQNQRNTIICVFMDSVRHGEFSSSRFDTLKGDTARKAADHVSTIISASCGFDPRKTLSGETCIQIKRQLKAYKANDGPTKHQKALPPEVYCW
jgi:hypothetical protein